MRPLLIQCPSCHGNLSVTRQECPSCAIKFEGDFALPSLLRLTPAQLDFVEVFVKNRGIIREVERELGVSYPTVRARLDEVIAALGFTDRRSDETASPAARRRAILADLKAGRITSEEALAALSEAAKPDR